MRLRTIAALVTGAALGAGGTYLLDPEHGPRRRREALRTAWERGRRVDWSQVGSQVAGGAGDLGRRAVTGYRDGLVQASGRQPAGRSERASR